MRNLLSLFFIVGLTVSASAQRVYFIYMQTDNYNPFYLKMNDKIFSSTPSGYLILSNLVDSTYNFSIGFPSSQLESKFSVSINTKDKGFLIKNFDSGLGLFDLQALSIIKAQPEDGPKNISYQRRNDNFTTLLSKAANDTSLLYAVVTVKQDIALKEPSLIVEENKQKTEEPLKKDETLLVKDTVAVTPTRIENDTETKKEALPIIEKKEESKTVTVIDSAQTKEPLMGTDSTLKNVSEKMESYKRSVVKKYSESSTSEGFGLVFYDGYDEGTDTIRLLIPNPKFIIKQNEPDSVVEQKQFIQPDELKADTSFQKTIVVTNNPKAPIKSNCRSQASENDFFKLRKNMATKPTDEGMVDEAKKVFKNKCFSTEQIKNLSALFLTSAGKYQFFDAAYLHVTDQDQFPSLQTEIKDDYYIKRFKAMIGE